MSVNKVILIGNVGKDPDIRYLDNNVCVANFPLATTDRAYTTRAGVQITEKTEWHNIVLWRGLAEIAEKYVRKGTQLYIEGKIRTRSWVDQSNITRYTTEIYADNMELLGRKNEQIGASPVSQIDNPVQPSLTSPVQGSNVDSGNNDIDDLPF